MGKLAKAKKSNLAKFTKRNLTNSKKSDLAKAKKLDFIIVDSFRMKFDIPQDKKAFLYLYKTVTQTSILKDFDLKA